MALQNSAATLTGSLSWKQTKTVSGFNSSEQSGSVSFNEAVTADHPYFTTFSLAAAASQTIDFRAITTALGESITATEINTIIIKATAATTGGKIRIAPGASNGLVWPFDDASDKLTLSVGTSGADLIFKTGVDFTIDATHKTWDISNPGSQTITVYLAALVMN